MITFETVEDLKAALLRAEAAHAEFEKNLGHRDEDWVTYYAAFMAGFSRSLAVQS